MKYLKLFEEFNLKNQLTNLANSLRNYPNINLGGCGIFAYLVGKRLLEINKIIPQYAVLYSIEDNLSLIENINIDNFVIPNHVFLYIDNLFYDYTGFKTYEEVSKDYYFGNNFKILFPNKNNIYELSYDIPEDDFLVLIMNHDKFKKLLNTKNSFNKPEHKWKYLSNRNIDKFDNKCSSEIYNVIKNNLQ